jgi:hypothetical protein
MKGHGQKLNRKQEALIAALLTEPTHAGAAAKAGVCEATLHRWLRLSEFQAAYRQARRGIVEAAIGRLKQTTGKAVEALDRNLTCGQAGNEIRAAQESLITPRSSTWLSASRNWSGSASGSNTHRVLYRSRKRQAGRPP